jgi:Dyp-type peroxidase family
VTAPLDLTDIQGFVLFAYAALPRAAYLHVSFDAKGATANAWLASVLPELQAAHRHAREDQTRLHVALTSGGLARFGLTSDEVSTFPREFQDGMGDPLRSRVLGDTGDNAPERWEFGAPGQPAIDAVVLLFAKEPGPLAALRERVRGGVADHGGKVVHEDDAAVRSPPEEPFGFHDGIGQPFVAGTPRARRTHEVTVAAGEFLLGYANAYGETPATPRGRNGFDLGKNGSFLVYRKLRQRTHAFWKALLEAADPPHDDAAATKLAAKLVGRWPSGAPVVLSPDADPGYTTEPTFAFHKEDPTGDKCPFGAHIRRANPRDMLPPSQEESLTEVGRHRILRRGRPFGPAGHGTPSERAKEDGVERGLVFLALNASFRRQFEFVQQTWVNNPKFAGLYDERDPLVSTFDAGQYSLPGSPARRRLPEMQRFVAVRGGGYFFVPGLRATEWIAKLA